MNELPVCGGTFQKVSGTTYFMSLHASNLSREITPGLLKPVIVVWCLEEIKIVPDNKHLDICKARPYVNHMLYIATFDFVWPKERETSRGKEEETGILVDIGSNLNMSGSSL